MNNYGFCSFNLYPTPQTVTMYIGLSESGSIFFRSLQMNEGRLLVYFGIFSNPHTFS